MVPSTPNDHSTPDLFTLDFEVVNEEQQEADGESGIPYHQRKATSEDSEETQLDLLPDPPGIVSQILNGYGMVELFWNSA
ncbi:UNVERIFIED_CONTAM: hypothetical protein K2H54_053052 [Gekko kuhli]